jgi:rod shape determining protein RodA
MFAFDNTLSGYASLLIMTIAGVVVAAIYAFRKNIAAMFLTLGIFIISVAFVPTADTIFESVLKEHQKVRILSFLGIMSDPSGADYNVNQSKIAIGSGGFSGKGFLNGTQTKLKYVPEQHTDFIFCTVCEEFGFLGALAVILTYLALIYRLLYLAEHQSSRFSRIYGYCVACIFFFHLLINIGMVIGLMPVIGIPLPFFSYGGSSLWSFTILLFIFLCLDKAEK